MTKTKISKTDLTNLILDTLRGKGSATTRRLVSRMMYATDHKCSITPDRVRAICNNHLNIENVSYRENQASWAFISSEERARQVDRLNLGLAATQTAIDAEVKLANNGVTARVSASPKMATISLNHDALVELLKIVEAGREALNV